MDCSPPGSSVHGVVQAGVLEWVAIAYSKKDYDRDITPVVEPVKVPAHLVLPGSSIRGISQARVLEWGAIAFSEGDEREVQKRGHICIPVADSC